jgi:hypothetical protein
LLGSVTSTCRLIVAPKSAWQELARAHVLDTIETGEDASLPNPALHGAAVGGCSALVTALATAAYGASNFGDVLRATLAAVSGCVGATAVAVLLVPFLVSAAQTTQPQLARYATVTSLPLAAGGLVSLLPHAVPKTLAIAALGALAYRSGSLGAHTFLGLAGAQKARAASVTALVSTLPALLTALLCTIR